jgi:DNA-binding transcriptional LysR family regulator
MHGIALKYFLEVAQTGSLSSASKRMHVAVSAISRQISGLEEEVHAPLFERMPRGMVLTEAGKLLLAHARRTVLESESVLNQIAGLHGSSRNEIRVAASEGLAQNFMPVAMAEFRRAHPQTRFSLYVLPPIEARRRIIEGEIDVAVNFTVERSQGVMVRYSWHAPVHAVMAATHPLAGRGRLGLEDLLAYPLALTDGYSTARSLLERGHALNAIPMNMEIALESNYSQALLKFVGHSEAITFAGYLSVAWRLEHDELIAKLVDSIELQSRNLQLQTMEGRVLPPVIDAFIGQLKTRIDQAESLSA